MLGTYLHSVTGQVPIKFVLDRFADDPSVGVGEGDIYYCNEALYGGIHNPDQFALMPVFSDGELIGWVVSGAHQSETGGSEPGGEVTQAHTRHDEGMKLTPIKIGENYRLRNDLLLMMENFISRAPRMQVTDVKARVAACDRVRDSPAGTGRPAQQRPDPRALPAHDPADVRRACAPASRAGPTASTATTCSWTPPATSRDCCARRSPWRCEATGSPSTSPAPPPSTRGPTTRSPT